ncbi:5-methyltetrahydropteroyltriglutamate--homocysteine S-methyltransferase [Myceligenerans pegani]|uniref:5-methyltetrahydropteroyltriglutamate--homocysteine methyltransferase n=1 Tax=Myceligenerans pegani TaxID=2776917 RepID=A0ABR9N2M1_9MICO|nr:5-methyltetrahydropteroyltriglutamate--homocysteine S-methyltransferase [Myceligenerans sp. TRM 65318]MBE1877893.1 5-methyltetrahydropteroyltriglutamate--homocysteine S-methyltransferase [Myceligenerans sp. TRM 65318]MBE3020164.1 5-methyltetrahydropteroyltriglutamate--homocysteine S-methyltransferase [Myceligenerans sp. TRM 65318]
MTDTTAPDSPRPDFPHATALGYPRIGRRRELKRALESYWAGTTTADDLERTSRELRLATVRRLVELGLDPGTGAVPNSFSRYDQVLDVTATLGAIPARFGHLAASSAAESVAGASTGDRAGLAPTGSATGISTEAYFALARGTADQPPLELTKWFDTNYHYLVPEIGPETPIGFADDRIVREFTEAARPSDGGTPVVTRPVVVGPVTYLLLSKPEDGAPEDFSPLSRLDDVVAAYRELLAALAAAGAPWVQLDEPALVSDLIGVPFDGPTGPGQDRNEPESAPRTVSDAVRRAYATLTAPEAGAGRPQILVAAPFGDLRRESGDRLELLAGTDVEAIALDLVRGTAPSSRPAVQDAADGGPGNAARGAGLAVPGLASKTLVAGVIDGHNIWRADLAARLDLLESLRGTGAGAIAVGTSTSLLHVPHDVADEPRLDPALAGWLAFADQKVGEVVTLARGLREGRAAVEPQLAEATAAVTGRADAAGVVVPAVRDRLARLSDGDFARAPYADRAAAQRTRLDLPPLPTTTIGSFPQTTEIRTTRAAWTRGDLTDADYEARIREEIARVVALQEELGLDVLVHGEPERNDMVQYFAERLAGFATTVHGWVQSYGSRCVRPPILWGDVSRPEPITVPWATYAASLTEKPVKGMLTGPVTILAWSFVRDDQPLADTANQVALALRDEVADLETAGIAIVQVDEAALRELLPLDAAAQPAYLDWSVRSFRLTTSGAAPSTQIHTHLCYSEFGDIVGAIDDLDADVTSVEAARSRMEIVPGLASAGYARGIGPGVWDIHSPRVPSDGQVSDLLKLAVAEIDPRLVWVNPDCGLKTRGYEETTASLTNLVAAAREVRASL